MENVKGYFRFGFIEVLVTTDGRKHFFRLQINIVELFTVVIIFLIKQIKQKKKHEENGTFVILLKNLCNSMPSW